MVDPSSPQFSRVLVALGAAAPSRPALETGITLAAAVGASLIGLFVEDTNLVRLGALPLASVTSALTGARRPLTAGEMERALRVEAAWLEQLLSESAARTRIAWSFVVTRGEIFAEAASRDADLIVLGARVHTEAPRDSSRSPRQLIVVFDASPEALRALEATTLLARTLSCTMLILVPEDEDAGSRGAFQAARDWLTSEGIAGLVLPLAADQHLLEAAARSRKVALVALPAPVLAQWPIDIAALAAAVRCPLVIAR